MVAVMAIGLLTLATPAWADTTIYINPGNVPATAADYTNECQANQGGGPYADKDVWVFNLPGNTGAFVSVTATWQSPGGPVTKTIPTDGGAIVTIGTSKAWIDLPAGWTLLASPLPSAVITGTADKFVLTHTCPADPGATPSPDPSDPPGSPDPSGSATPSNGTTTTPGGDLPRTGAPIAGMLLTGAITIGGGAAVLWFLRRRRTVLGD
jgi:hypothetical protein